MVKDLKDVKREVVLALVLVEVYKIRGVRNIRPTHVVVVSLLAFALDIRESSLLHRRCGDALESPPEIAPQYNVEG